MSDPVPFRQRQPNIEFGADRTAALNDLSRMTRPRRIRRPRGSAVKGWIAAMLLQLSCAALVLFIAYIGGLSAFGVGP